jgi:hypothetical protein
VGSSDRAAEEVVDPIHDLWGVDRHLLFETLHATENCFSIQIHFRKF